MRALQVLALSRSTSHKARLVNLSSPPPCPRPLALPSTSNLKFRVRYYSSESKEIVPDDKEKKMNEREVGEIKGPIRRETFLPGEEAGALTTWVDHVRYGRWLDWRVLVLIM